MLGEKIKETRMKLKITRQELADKVDIKINSLTNIEHGKATAGDDTIKRIANILKLNNNELLKIKQNDEIILDPQDIVIGAKIKYYRQLNGYTQLDLAVKLGYSGSGPICTIEQGKRGMSKNSLLRCCELFNIHIAEIIAPVEIDETYKNFMKLFYAKEKPPIYASISSLIVEAVRQL